MGLVLVYIQVIICREGRGCFLCLRMRTLFRTYSLVGWLKNGVIGKLCYLLILTTYSYCDCVFMIIMLWKHANMRVYTCLNRTLLLVLKSLKTFKMSFYFSIYYFHFILMCMRCVFVVVILIYFSIFLTFDKGCYIKHFQVPTYIFNCTLITTKI